MDTFFAIQQTTYSRITELHQQRAQLNLSAEALAQGDSLYLPLPFAFIRAALSVKSRLAVVLMLAVSLWFGLQTWMNQSAIHASNALAFNIERYVIAAVIMGLICWRVRARFTKRAVLGGCVTGFAFAVMIACESQSLMQGAAERASFLGSIYVILMPFLGRFLRRQKLYRTAVVGSVIVIIGTWCLFGAPSGNPNGDFFAILRAAACAGMLLAVQFFAGEDWRVASLSNLIVVALFSIVVGGLTGQLQLSLHPTVLIPAALSGVFGSVAGASVLMWSGRYLSSALAGVLMFLEAPFTLLWGIILMGAVLTPASLTAYTLIGAGTLCVLAAGSLQLPRLRLRFTRQFGRSTGENALTFPVT